MKCIRAIKNVLLDKESGLLRNIFSNDEVCQLGVTFLYQGRKFSYDFWYNAKAGEYVYESFTEILKDQYGNEKEVLWLKRDTIKEEYFCIDEDAQKMMPIISKNNLFCYLVDTTKFEALKEMKNILVGFAEKIDIINWSDDPAILIKNALGPAKVLSVDVYDDEKSARVIVPDNQLSLAIIIAALLVGSSLVMLIDVGPRFYEMPVLGFVGFTISLALGVFTVLRYFIDF